MTKYAFIIAEVEEGVKRAILATNLGIELKPAQVGLKVQGRELKLAWAQLLATLVSRFNCPHLGSVSHLVCPGRTRPYITFYSNAQPTE